MEIACALAFGRPEMVAGAFFNEAGSRSPEKPCYSRKLCVYSTLFKIPERTESEP